MSPAGLMSEPKKKTDAADDGGKKKQNPGVKLTPRFHKKLKHIANDLGIDMGPLIEREMSDFVDRESKRIAGDLLADSPED
jgi:hypothetical protein